MANIEIGTADGSTLGNPPAGMFFWFVDSNNANKFTQRTPAGVDTVFGVGTISSVNGDTGPTVVLDADDIDDTTTAHKFVSAADIILIASALQSGDNVSELVNDAGYITASSLPPSFSVDLDSAEASVTRAVAGGRTTFTVTHGLNTLDIKPEVFQLSNGQTIGGWRIRRTGVNTVEARRNGNIADGDFRMVI
jgi:hypothetical protein